MVTIGTESFFVIIIYRPSDKAKLSQFDEILSVIFGADDCVFLVVDLNSDALYKNNQCQ